MADHGKELSEKARQFTGSRAKTSAKFDVKKFVDAFAGGAALGSPSERTKLAIQRATKLVAAAKSLQKETGFSITQVGNILKGLDLAGKDKKIKKSLSIISKAKGFKSSTFFQALESVGSGKKSTIKKSETFFEKHLPKPSAGKVDKALTGLFKKIF